VAGVVRVVVQALVRSRPLCAARRTPNDDDSSHAPHRRRSDFCALQAKLRAVLKSSNAAGASKLAELPRSSKGGTDEAGGGLTRKTLLAGRDPAFVAGRAAAAQAWLGTAVAAIEASGANGKKAHGVLLDFLSLGAPTGVAVAPVGGVVTARLQRIVDTAPPPPPPPLPPPPILLAPPPRARGGPAGETELERVAAYAGLGVDDDDDDEVGGGLEL
jgi:hypothetical protein